MPDTAVIILNYNGAAFLQKFLPGVIRHSPECTVWVVDNASSDDSLEVLKTRFPEVHVLPLDDNYGFSQGYNLAAWQIETEFCIFLNSDIEVSEGWAAPLIEILQKEELTAVVQPKILAFHRKSHFEYAGAAGGQMDKYGYPFCRGRLFDTVEQDAGQYDLETPVFWASGACMAVKREVFIREGGFDAYYFAHMEEIDFCWRIQNRGHQIKYTPHATVYHVGGGTLAMNSPGKVFLNFRNSLLTLVKNLPAKQLFPRLLMRLVLDFPAAILFLIRGHWKQSIMVMKAHLSFYQVFLRYYKARQNGLRSINTMPGYINKSIVFKYYCTGVRKSSEL